MNNPRNTQRIVIVDRTRDDANAHTVDVRVTYRIAWSELIPDTSDARYASMSYDTLLDRVFDGEMCDNMIVHVDARVNRPDDATD